MMYVIYEENSEKGDSVLYNLSGNFNSTFVDTYPEPSNKRFANRKLSIHKYSNINDAFLDRKSLEKQTEKKFVIKTWRTESGIGDTVLE